MSMMADDAVAKEWQATVSQRHRPSRAGQSAQREREQRDRKASSQKGAARVPARALRRLALLAIVLIACVGSIVGQLVRLGLSQTADGTFYSAAVVASSVARPDILDRKGRLLATDLVRPSLFVDPTRVRDADALALALHHAFPDASVAHWHGLVTRRNTRFVWLRRALEPTQAQNLHDAGFAGLGFRDELHRVYPKGMTVGHITGGVDIDNIARSGIELYIDREIGTETIVAPGRTTKAPVRLSIDLAAQHAFTVELRAAMARYRAEAAAGLILSAKTGEILSLVSLPALDPADPSHASGGERINRIVHGRYELGSVFKIFAVAAAMESGLITPRTRFSVADPIKRSRVTISDAHPSRDPLTLRQVLLRSSNIGAARATELIGPGALRSFYERLDIMTPLRSELASGLKPLGPPRWDDLHAMTASFGHGLAITPLRFAASAATLLNRGRPVVPTLLKWHPGQRRMPARPVVAPAVSQRIGAFLRDNVREPEGTANLAAVRGFDVGGKTGTAEQVVDGRYARDKVISSFLGVVPVADPQIVTMVMLFSPRGEKKYEDAGRPRRGAGHTAAPTTARVIERLAPILGLYRTVRVTGSN